jgi:hypothetical protein
MPTSTAPSITTFLAQINSVINNPRLQGLEQKSLAAYFSNLDLFKVISIVISAFFIGCTVYFIIKTGWLALRLDRIKDVILKSNMPKKRSIKAWQGIKKHFFAGDEANLKLALLEADKVLDETLRLSGFQGETLGDKLKRIQPAQLPNIQEIWEAHKLRNRLAHEPNFNLNRDLAERALTIYEQAFKDLGLLD